jgi:hypothetical protein
LTRLIHGSEKFPLGGLRVIDNKSDAVDSARAKSKHAALVGRRFRFDADPRPWLVKLFKPKADKQTRRF